MRVLLAVLASWALATTYRCFISCFCAIPILIQFLSNLELLVPLEKIYVKENVFVSACMCVHIHETEVVKKHA